MNELTPSPLSAKQRGGYDPQIYFLDQNSLIASEVIVNQYFSGIASFIMAYTASKMSSALGFEK
jgi:hypothetical protein